MSAFARSSRSDDCEELIEIGDTGVIALTGVDCERAMDYCVRYLGSWGFRTVSKSELPVLGTVNLVADPARVRETELLLDRREASLTQLVREPYYVFADDRGTVALNANGTVALHVHSTEHGGSHVDIIGHGQDELATLTARIVREVGRAALARAGWRLMHASGVVARDGSTLVALGGKGAGKTATALTMAVEAGWGLLANDRLFVRAADTVEAMAWPSAVPIGFGLAHALGILSPIREHVEAGEALHDSQHPLVTRALLDGARDSVRYNGRELKLHLFPSQLTGWLGIELVHRVDALDVVVRPNVTFCGGRPAWIPSAVQLEDDDFLDADDETYPDMLNLRSQSSLNVSTDATMEVPLKITGLPGARLTLGQSTRENAYVLERLVRGSVQRTAE